MEAPGRRAGDTVIERLLAEPYNFDFFQAVRLLERAAAEFARYGASDSTSQMTGKSVGRDASPDAEVIRFRAVSSLAFPGGQVIQARAPTYDARTGTGLHGFELSVNLMGITGATGALPYHYTSLIIERLRDRDPGLAEFFDLFNHRLISLFFRSWEKYRFPTAYERVHAGDEHEASAPQNSSADDVVTACMYSLVGLGSFAQRDRGTIDDETFLRYAGLFSSSRHSATGLERMVADHLGVPARVQQFCGQWLYLDKQDRSSLPARALASENCVLGRSVVLGNRVWDVQSRFRVTLGPIGYTRYCRFLPGGEDYVQTVELIRGFVGAEFDFDLQPLLSGEEIPRCKLGVADPTPQRLGQNLWLSSRRTTTDFSGAAFVAA